MELKNKTLEDFWIWYLLPENKVKYKTQSLFGSDSAIKVRFLAMSFTERYSVFVDFFESVGVIIDIQPLLDYDKEKYTKVYSYLFSVNQLNVIVKSDDNYNRNVFEVPTREEARVKAIEQANELYNKI